MRCSWLGGEVGCVRGLIIMKARVFDIRGDDAGLYPTLAEWWAGHGWDAVPFVVLPRCGVLVENGDGMPVAAAFLYMENSGVGVAWMEWTVTNPSISPRVAFLAITMLTQSVREVALELDYGVVMTTARQESLVRVLKRNGFTVTDREMTHLLMFTKS